MYDKDLNSTSFKLFMGCLVELELGIKDAKKLADELGRPCLIPLVVSNRDYSNPTETYLYLRHHYHPSYLLKSAEGPRKVARYSVIGCRPLLHLTVRDGIPKIEEAPNISELLRKQVRKAGRKSDALEMMEKAMFIGDMQIPPLELPRYVFGVTGYVSYDFIRSSVTLDPQTTDDLHHPDLEFMLPGLLIIFDHLKDLTHYCSLMLLRDGSDTDDVCEGALSNLKKLVNLKPTHKTESQKRIVTSSNIKKKDFEGSVKRIKEYVRAGDVIQTVLSRRIELRPAPPLERFYINLERVNPSPYMFFLDFPERSVIGSSPEALVRVSEREVITRPIAGTRRRGKNKRDDLEMERDLVEDEKERAEHIMLVDLGRNDVGRVSEFGSVKVPEFMGVEKYGHVQHLVSTVVGHLRGNQNAFNAFRAIFPAGTVTGAPKVRAMEIIEELEPTRRGIYAGAVGSFSYTGEADLAITIRTLVAERDRGYIQVGAGVVADSVPWKEYYETENKARSLLRAAGV